MRSLRSESERAKMHARRRGTSLSRIVADYFALLDGGSTEQTNAPITRSLRGILRDSGLDESDYGRHLERKHL